MKNERYQNKKFQRFSRLTEPFRNWVLHDRRSGGAILQASDPEVARALVNKLDQMVSRAEKTGHTNFEYGCDTVADDD